jgi:hypothetical protein
MNNIVKEAIKYLVPTQFKEVLGESVSSIQSNLSHIRDKAKQAMNQKLNALTYAVLREELDHMHRQGYTPRSGVVLDAMKYVIETKDVYDHYANYNPSKLFIWIKPDCIVYGDCETNAKQVASTDDLPEDVRGKLFVLMVGDKNKFIEDVGMKVEYSKFWVLV